MHFNSYEEKREERLEYENDVYYEVWRAGGDPEKIDSDRIDEARLGGLTDIDAARQELKGQMPRPMQEESDY